MFGPRYPLLSILRSKFDPSVGPSKSCSQYSTLNILPSFRLHNVQYKIFGSQYPFLSILRSKFDPSVVPSKFCSQYSTLNILPSFPVHNVPHAMFGPCYPSLGAQPSVSCLRYQLLRVRSSNHVLRSRAEK